MKIRVLLIDDHFSVHQGIRAIFDAYDDLELVGHGTNGQQAVEMCQQLLPDVIIMDVMMPGMNGIEATQLLRREYPEIKVLALSSFSDQQAIWAMIDAGANGFLLKDASIDNLAETIRAIVVGQAVFSEDIISQIFASHTMVASLSPSNDYRLTDREKEILKAMVEGLNNTEIASKLFISVATVKFHVSNVIAKLKVENRVEVVAKALKESLLD